MRQRVLLRLLLAFALVFAGSAAQLHSLAHAQHDLAALAHGEKGPPPLNHATDRCLVVHALDGTAAGTGALRLARSVAQCVVPPMAARSGAAPAVAFRSRAPPLPA